MVLNQGSRSPQSISYFPKIFSLISKLPKIKTKSSGIRKIPRKLLRTRSDVYFLFLTSKINLSNFKNSGSHNPTSLKEFRPRNSLNSTLVQNSSIAIPQGCLLLFRHPQAMTRNIVSVKIFIPTLN